MLSSSPSLFARSTELQSVKKLFHFNIKIITVKYFSLIYILKCHVLWQLSRCVNALKTQSPNSDNRSNGAGIKTFSAHKIPESNCFLVLIFHIIKYICPILSHSQLISSVLSHFYYVIRLMKFIRNNFIHLDRVPSINPNPITREMTLMSITWTAVNRRCQEVCCCYFILKNECSAKDEAVNQNCLIQHEENFH